MAWDMGMFEDVFFSFFSVSVISESCTILAPEWCNANNGFKTTVRTKANANGKIIKNADGTYILLKSNDTEQRF